MRINFTFRNLESSEGIKAYASEKVSRVQKHLRMPSTAEITVSTEKHLHHVDISLQSNGRRYAAHDQSEDMYASIDRVMDKIDRQVRDAKATTTTRKRHSGSSLAAGKGS
ncbi:MAG: ribosome-associated translation inhibitor RaiA [Polyangiales bacterium]